MNPVNVPDLVQGVRAKQRGAIARAITLVESTRSEDREPADRMLRELLPQTGTARRVGISGVPGVGKSTFIDELGVRLSSQGARVAVLAVDPSSAATHGSVLGDKTRMGRLAGQTDSFIRPSPNAGTLGGRGIVTNKAMVVLEAAGYDPIIVETVGVGQSETAVSEMVDTFVFLTLARTGDQLQGIKRGILELADVIAVNKADGEYAPIARQAARELRSALHMVAPERDVPVLTCSAVTGEGIDEVWQAVLAHGDRLSESGELERRRSRQQVQWLWRAIEDQLVRDFRSSASVADLLARLEAEVADQRQLPTAAAALLIAAFTHEQDRAGTDE